MRKVALVTWYNSINYGTCLQAYALYKTLINMGYEVYIPEHIQYKTIITFRDAVRRVNKKITKIINYSIAKNKSNHTLSYLEDEYLMRKCKINNFVSRNMSIWSMQGKRNTSFKKLNDEMDIFITGSDQIWNPYYMSLASLLNFVDETKKKVAYASSIGVEKIPNDLKIVYKKYLTRFNSLSVREKDNADMLSELINKEVSHVVDPTLLLNRNDLIELSSIHNGVNLEPYMLCYFLGNNQEWVIKAKEVAEMMNLKIVVLLSESRIVPNLGVTVASAGIEEFLGMLNMAKYVFTDSFHCTALSLNLQKEFFVFKRFKDSDNNSQNTRIYSILSTFGLEERLITYDTNISILIHKNINYTKVIIELEKLRNNSIRYLKNALL